MPTFLDEAKIHVQAGSGGNGAVHFHREKYVPAGGPDGGDAGNGGSVILRADRGINTLFTFQRQRHFKAESGQPGGPNRMSGRAGKDRVIDVPVGTMVRDAESGELLGDLTRHGQSLVVARGGKGGLGNVHFKTSTHQVPRFAEKGEPGGERWLELELRLIAEVGLIGLPNAGKSTLLSVISAARPKIADYPFTTLTPNLGVVEVGDETFVAADIPGLIEGAHEGVGLGIEFLRHIERTLVLIHVVDASSPDAVQAFHQVNEELRQYDEDLLRRPQLIALNKIDLPDARDRVPELERSFGQLGSETFPISAVTREGIDSLMYRTAALLQERAARPEEPPDEGIEVITIKPSPDRFEIERKRKTFYVRGETVERLAVMTDTSSEEAMHRLEQRLKRMGVFTALQRAGVQEGNTVRIGPIEFTWDSSYEPGSQAGARGSSSRRRR